MAWGPTVTHPRCPASTSSVRVGKDQPMLDSQNSAAHALRGAALGGPSLGTCGMEPLGGDMLGTQGGAWVPLTLRVSPQLPASTEGQPRLGEGKPPSAHM